MDLGYNQISREINKDFFALRNLKSLNLEKNNILNITSSAFQLNPLLDNLNFHGNNLLGKDVENLARTLNSLNLLKILDVSKLRIAYLPSHIFKGLVSLERLALGTNDLTGWDAPVFTDQKNLTVLTVTDNKINHISRKQFKYLVALKEIYLAANPFKCTCELLSLIQWIENPRGLYFGGVEDYICNSPVKWAKKPLLEFNISEDDCQSYLWADIIIAGGCFYIFLVTLSTIGPRKT